MVTMVDMDTMTCPTMVPPSTTDTPPVDTVDMVATVATVATVMVDIGKIF